MTIEGFYGRLKKKDSERLLKNSEDGVYLLRLSCSKRGNWVFFFTFFFPPIYIFFFLVKVVSFSVGNGNVKHLTILHLSYSDSFQVVTWNPQKTEEFSNLKQAVEYVKMTFKFKTYVVVEPPHKTIFVEYEDFSNNYICSQKN